MIAIILLIVGLLLLLVEFFLPGGILAVIAGITILISIFKFASESPSLLATALYIVIVICLLIGVVKFALWRIKKTQESKTILSDDSQSGFQASSYDKSLIGKHAVVSTDLRPGGHIMVDGMSYLALSQSGFLSKGEEVLIIGGEGDSLIVKHIKKEKMS